MPADALLEIAIKSMQYLALKWKYYDIVLCNDLGLYPPQPLYSMELDDIQIVLSLFFGNLIVEGRLVRTFVDLAWGL